MTTSGRRWDRRYSITGRPAPPSGAVGGGAAAGSPGRAVHCQACARPTPTPTRPRHARWASRATASVWRGTCTCPPGTRAAPCSSATARAAARRTTRSWASRRRRPAWRRSPSTSAATARAAASWTPAAGDDAIAAGETLLGVSLGAPWLAGRGSSMGGFLAAARRPRAAGSLPLAGPPLPGRPRLAARRPRPPRRGPGAELPPTSLDGALRLAPRCARSSRPSTWSPPPATCRACSSRMPATTTPCRSPTASVSRAVLAPPSALHRPSSPAATARRRARPRSRGRPSTGSRWGSA